MNGRKTNDTNLQTEFKNVLTKLNFLVQVCKQLRNFLVVLYSDIGKNVPLHMDLP